jgi:hypothetical protein
VQQTPKHTNKQPAVLLLVLVFACYSCLAATVPACAQSAGHPTMVDSLQHIESSLGLAVDPAAPLPQRVVTIEQRLFGGPQQGSLQQRIERARLQFLGPASPAQPALPGPGSATAPPFAPGSPASSAVNPDVELPSAAGANTGALHDSLPLLHAISPNFVRIEPPGPTAGTADDYFQEVLKGSKGKILRFKQMPIPVFINAFPDRAFVVAVVRGFSAWEDLSGGAVRFVQVDSQDKARIYVVWKHLGTSADRSGCMLGAHTITKYTPRGNPMTFIQVGLVPVPLVLPRVGPKYTVPPQVIEVNMDLIMSKDPHVRYHVLQNVVTHELGHALGLLGHSSDQFDMMSPITDEHSRLSARDINTLKKLYQHKVDVPL